MIRNVPEFTTVHKAPVVHRAAPLHRIQTKKDAATTPFSELMTQTPPAAVSQTSNAPAANAAAPVASAPASQVAGSSGPSLAALFSVNPQPAGTSSAQDVGTQVPSVPDPSSVPTLQSVFGPNPWITNPTGHDFYGNNFNFNPTYFATEQTAEKVAQLLGGKVIQKNDILPSGPIGQNQPNYMVQLTSGAVVNPGLVAAYYTHGYPQSYIDRMLAAEAAQRAMS